MRAPRDVSYGAVAGVARVPGRRGRQPRSVRAVAGMGTVSLLSRFTPPIPMDHKGLMGTVSLSSCSGSQPRSVRAIRNETKETPSPSESPRFAIGSLARSSRLHGPTLVRRFAARGRGPRFSPRLRLRSQRHCRVWTGRWWLEYSRRETRRISLSAVSDRLAGESVRRLHGPNAGRRFAARDVGRVLRALAMGLRRWRSGAGDRAGRRAVAAHPQADVGSSTRSSACRLAPRTAGSRLAGRTGRPLDGPRARSIAIALRD